MGQLRTNIHVESTLTQEVQVIRKRLPLPGDAFLQNGARDIFDAFHQFDQQIVVAWTYRRKSDAAIAHHHGRDPMMARRRHAVGPGRLTIVVGVNIDKPRRDQRARRIDLAVAGPVDCADFDDARSLDGNIGRPRLSAAAVDQITAANHQVMLCHAYCLANRSVVSHPHHSVSRAARSRMRPSHRALPGFPERRTAAKRGSIPRRSTTSRRRPLPQPWPRLAPHHRAVPRAFLPE